jgi:glycosyltransferase involved in cell wall biosynthesis
MLRNKFSIYIPTYNRWGVLAKTLETTLANNWAGVSVVILDNNSNPAGQEVVLEVIRKYNDVPCRIEKNLFNLGGDGNILRCIEKCATPYVLVLGDDDVLCPDYLNKIEFFLNGEIDWGYISFKDRPCSAGEEVFRSPYELMAHAGNWADLLFMSTSIFNKEMFGAGMMDAQRAQVTHGAHLVGMLKGWEKLSSAGRSWEFLLSSMQLVESSGHGRDHRSYELMSIYAGLPLLSVIFQDSHSHYIVRNAVRLATKRVFKPRVLAKEFFRFTYNYGFGTGWRRMIAVGQGLNYSIGGRAFFYKCYLPLVVVVAGIFSKIYMIRNASN